MAICPLDVISLSEFSEHSLRCRTNTSKIHKRHKTSQAIQFSEKKMESNYISRLYITKLQ